jgi:hypothetical protein
MNSNQHRTIISSVIISVPSSAVKNKPLSIVLVCDINPSFVVKNPSIISVICYNI